MMKTETMVKIAVDILMLVCLLALMSYDLIGAATHEVLGTIMFALVIAHNALNLRWWRRLFKGKYTLLRTVQTVINVAILICMISQVISGIMMSKHLYVSLPIEGGTLYARTLHMVVAYWSFAIMSIHLGLHGNMFIGIAKKAFKIKGTSNIRIYISRITTILISAYGVFAFIHRQIGDYMLLKTQFVFFDYNEHIVFFFIDYLAVMLLFVFVGYYLTQTIRNAEKNKIKKAKTE